MSKETLAKSIREIPDFPIPGILFYDVTHDITGKPIKTHLGVNENGKVLIEMMKKSYDLLKDHPVNLKRIVKKNIKWFAAALVALTLGYGAVCYKEKHFKPAVSYTHLASVRHSVLVC